MRLSPGGRVFVALLALSLGVTDLAAQESTSACSGHLRFSSFRPECGQSRFVELARGSKALEERATLAPVVLRSGVRTAYPYESNNGGVWAGRGLSLALRGGVGMSWKALRLGFEPELIWVQNKAFPTAAVREDWTRWEYPWDSGRIDWPQRMGASAYARSTLGQSFAEVGVPGGAVGISTENVVIGPARRFPLLLGPSAPGFLHAYLSFPGIDTRVGRFSGDLLWGRLDSSEFFREPSRDVLVVATGSWASPTEAVRLWVTAITRTRWEQRSLRTLFSFAKVSTAQGSEARAEDGLGGLSLEIRLSPALRAYGSWGRSDFFANLEDLLTQPDHSQMWLVGFEARSNDLELVGEFASTVASDSQHSGTRVVESSTVYRHSGNPKGHTHRGQLLGATIGPGGRALHLSLARRGLGWPRAVFVEYFSWDLDAFRRNIRPVAPDPARDGELVLALRGEHRIRDALVRISGGISRRWNRHYARFTIGNEGMPENETNLWFDLALSWQPPQLFERSGSD